MLLLLGWCEVSVCTRTVRWFRGVVADSRSWRIAGLSGGLAFEVPSLLSGTGILCSPLNESGKYTSALQ